MHTKYSRGQIDLAGEVLVGRNTAISITDATEILKYFRSIHAYPLLTFRIFIGRKLKQLGYGNTADVSQRLKRKSSILLKLRLLSGMHLSRMQDIGGIRIVLNDLSKVYELRDIIRKAERHGSFKSTFVDEKDYIKTPKSSGYRSLHLIYKYEKKVPIVKQCRIEIQIRTKIHHAWATAVEVLGTYLSQPLKQSKGDQTYLSLFTKIGHAFAMLEDGKKDEILFGEIKSEVEDLALISKLNGFSLATNSITKDKHLKDKYYYLIELDISTRGLHVQGFNKNQLEEANNHYSELETSHKNEAVEVVLVSVQDLSRLETLYPNYFLDTKDFIGYLHNVLNTRL